jgi:hypothetical protein
MFLLTYFANLSTRQNKREWFYIGFAITAITYFVCLHMDSSYQDHPFESRTIYGNLFISVGLVIPQLVSQIFVRNKIKHPIIFLQNKDKRPAIGAVLAILLLTILAFSVLSPNQYNVNDHTPVYDEFYIKSSFSFLLFYIPFLILIFEFTTQRTAFCDNGLYLLGLILDWGNFKSYSWLNPKKDGPDAWLFLDKNQNDTLILAPRKAIFKKQIKIFIPISEKMVIDEFLSQRIKLDSDK